MKLNSMLGVKIFKETENDIELYRITHIQKYKDINDNPASISVINLNTNEKSKIRTDSLKEYKVLEPDGIFTAAIVPLKDNEGNIHKDVIVTGTKYLNIHLLKDVKPYCICRQCCTDIFYNLMCNDYDDMMAGISVSQDTCPSNFDFGLLMATDGEAEKFEFVNFYRTDTLDNILSLFNNSKFDEVLSNLYFDHIKDLTKEDPSLLMKKHHRGWCKDLKTLLIQNNFQADLNQMLGITDVDFNISDYMVEQKMPNSDNNYYTLKNEMQYWLSYTYGINITKTFIINFDHDINLADYNNSRYFLMRDNTKTLYLIVYTIDGEYKEKELEEKSKELDFSSKFRLSYFEKYNNKIKK